MVLEKLSKKSLPRFHLWFCQEPNRNISIINLQKKLHINTKEDTWHNHRVVVGYYGSRQQGAKTAVGNLSIEHWITLSSLPIRILTVTNWSPWLFSLSTQIDVYQIRAGDLLYFPAIRNHGWAVRSTYADSNEEKSGSFRLMGRKRILGRIVRLDKTTLVREKW